MAKIKIGVFSDPHLDFYIDEGIETGSPKFFNKLEMFIKDLEIPDNLDVIVVAGDLGHYNSQTIELLKALKTKCRYVVAVTGNHDYYLVSKSQQAKYNYSSSSRVKELQDAINTLDGIHLLDGDTITVDGVVFGGLTMWYNLDNARKKQLWTSSMSDSRLIMEGVVHTNAGWYGFDSTHYPTFDTSAFYQEQVNKLSKLRCNILVTHVSPIIIPDSAREFQFRHSPLNCMYESDNIEKVIETTTDLVLYGHTHTKMDYSEKGIKFICNPLGYPGEKLNRKIKVIDYEQ